MKEKTDVPTWLGLALILSNPLFLLAVWLIG